MKKTNYLLLLSLFLAFVSGSAQDFKIYVSDAGNFNNPPWQLLMFDENGDNPQQITTENLAWPQDILFLEDQDAMLVSNLNTGEITKYDANSGDFQSNFASGIGGPTRMKIGPDNLIYVLQWQGNGTVFTYEQDGTFVGEFTTVGVNQSIGLDWDSNGNLYVSSFGGASVRKFDTTGADQGLFIDSNLQGPTNIFFDDNDNLYVLDWTAGNVKKFDSNGTFMEIFIDGLSQPEGVDFYPNGNILIGDGGSGAVKLFDSEGMFIEDIVTAGDGNLLQPNAVVLRDATLSIPDYDKDNILVTPTIGDQFLIEPTTLDTFHSLQVFDISGKKIANIDLSLTNMWSASNLKEGVYFLLASNPNKKVTQKIVVKKK